MVLFQGWLGMAGGLFGNWIFVLDVLFEVVRTYLRGFLVTLQHRVEDLVRLFDQLDWIHSSKHIWDCQEGFLRLILVKPCLIFLWGLFVEPLNLFGRRWNFLRTLP